MRSSKEIANEIKKINADGRKMGYLQNEGGEGYVHLADTTALENEFHAAKDLEFANEWTAETTATRRTAWNTKMGAIKGRKLVYADITNLEREFGFSFNDMKKAVAMYK